MNEKHHLYKPDAKPLPNWSLPILYKTPSGDPPAFTLRHAVGTLCARTTSPVDAFRVHYLYNSDCQLLDHCNRNQYCIIQPQDQPLLRHFNSYTYITLKTLTQITMASQGLDSSRGKGSPSLPVPGSPATPSNQARKAVAAPSEQQRTQSTTAERPSDNEDTPDELPDANKRNRKGQLSIAKMRHQGPVRWTVTHQLV